MANRFAIVAIAATLAAATMTAHAAGMPDSGSKNFVPGGDAPSYLTNENLAVAPGSAGQSPLGTAFNQPAGPQPAAAAPRAAETRARQHGKLTAGRRSSHRVVANSRTETRLRRVAQGRTVRDGRSARLGRDTRPVRAASGTASAPKTRTLKYGKANVRHTSAKSAARRG